MKSGRQKFKFILLTMLVFSGVVFGGVISRPHLASAADTTEYYEPDIKFPGLFEKVELDSSMLGKYLKAVYVYMVYVVGILAVVMIVYGGIKWVAAAGNAGRINDAKDVITNSIIGVVIALTSYLLLYLINPNLLVVDLPKLKGVATEYFNGARVKSVCTIDMQLDKGVTCGKLIKTGSETSGTTSVDTYCIATGCGNGEGVCAISYNEKTKYYFPIGCREATSPQYVTSSTAPQPVRDEAGDRQLTSLTFTTYRTNDQDPTEASKEDVGNLKSCGYVMKSYYLGRHCGAESIDKNRLSYCYITGLNATFTQPQLSPWNGFTTTGDVHTTDGLHPNTVNATNIKCPAQK